MDKQAKKMRPRTRTLDPYAEYARARMLEQISTKLSKKANNNITISEVNTTHLEERIIQM